MFRSIGFFLRSNSHVDVYERGTDLRLRMAPGFQGVGAKEIRRFELAAHMLL